MAVPGMTGGDQKPLLKYNAKTGKWHVDDQVKDKITFLADLEHGETGWIRFGEGLTPDFRMTTMAAMVAGGQFPPMPADVDTKGKPLFKRGFPADVQGLGPAGERRPDRPGVGQLQPGHGPRGGQAAYRMAGRAGRRQGAGRGGRRLHRDARASSGRITRRSSRS